MAMVRDWDSPFTPDMQARIEAKAQPDTAEWEECPHCGERLNPDEASDQCEHCGEEIGRQPR